jgi:hypothetical protein
MLKILNTPFVAPHLAHWHLGFNDRGPPGGGTLVNHTPYCLNLVLNLATSVGFGGDRGTLRNSH